MVTYGHLVLCTCGEEGTVEISWLLYSTIKYNTHRSTRILFHAITSNTLYNHSSVVTLVLNVLV